jgi:undecaprenyl-diphosphatase
MKLNLQLLMAFFISLFGFIGMSFLVHANHLVRFDSMVITFIQGFEAPWLTSAMKFFTYIGTIRFIAILSIFVLLFLVAVLKHRMEVLIYLAAVFCTPILNRLLKLYFQRERPDLYRLIDIGGYSFPSGHAMNAFSFYGILVFLIWRHIPSRWGRSAVILIGSFMIAAIGLSRIYLGVHYPSDIIGGYFASGYWLITVIWVFQRYQEKHFSRLMEA